MYRFLLRPAWIGFHLVVVLGIVLMVNLGFWQLRRLDQRQEFNARVEARIDEPAVELDALLAEVGDAGSIDDVEWRPVTVSGTYLPDEQFVVVNRSQNGRAGDNVATPMELADGSVLVVNRGFVPLGSEVPAAPSGPVTVTGLVRPSQERRSGQLADAAEGELAEVQRIDLERLAPQLPGAVFPLYLDLVSSDPPEAAGLPEPVERPELSEGPHLSYAVQWFIFSAAVAVGWVLAVRHSAAKRRAGLTVAAGRPDGPDAPPPAVDEPTTATH